MTSASELFYQRRSRVSRSVSLATDLDLEPLESDRSFHQNHNRRHHYHHSNRHDFDGCDPLRRSPHLRHHGHRLFSPGSERALVRLDQGTGQFVASTSSMNGESISRGSPSRLRLTGNDRLPGAVLLARARLVERLRGVSLSGNRQNGRASVGAHNGESSLHDELRVADVGDWRASWPAESSLATDSILVIDRQQVEQESNKKKPPGLTPDALDCLQYEVFSSFEEGAEGDVSQVSWDCSICLESFAEGDELIRLPCEHRFHSACLDPWVRTCGDCPYCRGDIVVNSDGS